MLELLFWLLLTSIIYAYFGYPLLVCLLARFNLWSSEKGDITPKVSFITVAYNEEDCIREKIENSLSFDYPRDKLDIIFVSDGSTDETNSIISKYAAVEKKKDCFVGRNENEGLLAMTGFRDIKFLRFNERRGKAACLNDAVLESEGEILVFSDANVIYEKGAIKKLIQNFNDNNIGGVTGEVRYCIDNASSNEGEGLFSKYERFIRKWESKFYSLIGVNGAMYAIRKKLYIPIREDIVTDDFVIALNVIAQGYKIAYEPEAKGVEKISSSAKDEFVRKVRMIAGGYQALNGFKGRYKEFPLPVIYEVISHKLFRWLAPFFLAGILFLNLFLLNLMAYRIFFILQMIFYTAVLLGYMLEKRKIASPLSYLYYFVAVNLAAVFGLFKFITGTQKVTWSRGR